MKKLILTLGLLVAFFYPLKTNAVLSEENIRIFNDISTTASNDETLANRVFNIITFAAGVVAIVYLMIGAFQYTTAGGDEDKAKTARQTIVYAVIGLIIVLSSAYIFRASTNLLSISAGGEAQQNF